MITSMPAKKRKCQKRHGFTLIEMLVVLAIIVLLATMVAPRFFGTQKKANRQKTEADIKIVQAQLERFHFDMKRFPSTEEGLSALVKSPSSGVSSEIDDGETANETFNTRSGGSSNWAGPYVTRMMKDPWGNSYQYEYPPTHGVGNEPDIWSFGPDGQDGTEDDIVSWSTSREEGGEGTDETGTDTENTTPPDNSTSNTTNNGNG